MRQTEYFEPLARKVENLTISPENCHLLQQHEHLVQYEIVQHARYVKLEDHATT